MNWRAPWLRKRVYLAGMAGWDAAVVYCCYIVIFRSKIGDWDYWSGSAWVAAICWLTTSYITGRYSAEAGNGQSFSREVTLASMSGLSVLIVFVGHGWVTGSINADTKISSFQIPFATASMVCSLLGVYVIEACRPKETAWCIVCTRKQRELIEYECEREGRKQRIHYMITDLTDDLEELDLASRRRIAVGDLGLIERVAGERLLEAKEGGAQVIDILVWCEQTFQRIPPELLKTSWLIGAEGFSLRPGGWMWRIKRYGDIMGSAVILILTAPLAIAAAISIKLEDGGPIFYKQTRTGLNGRTIQIWKLRSMKVNAEKDGIQWSVRNDDRVTRVGRFIRSTRIDELPQLISVVRGELSLIGPRPERPEVEDVLEREIPFYRVRHWVRPGLSGWAQVCYPYGASVEDSRAKLSYDVFYIRNAGLLIDALIVVKTIKLVLRAHGSEPKLNSTQIR